MDEVCEQKWLKKRRNSYFVYLVTFFTLGASGAGPTLWIYISTLMNVENKGLYYGLINASTQIPPMLFSAVVARRADKTGRITLWLIIVNFVAMCGSILYVTNFSPVCLIFGRTLTGFQTLLRPLIVGEIARSYKKEEVSGKIGLCILMRKIGRASSPLLLMAFTKLDIWYGSIHITYGNISGVWLFILCVLLQILVFTLHGDISRDRNIMEEDVKIVKEISGETPVSNNSSGSVCYVLKRILSNGDTALVLNVTFWASLWRRVGRRVIPIAVLDTLAYSVDISNICFIVYGVLTVAMGFLYTKYKDKNHLYYYGIVSLVSIIIYSTCLRLVSKEFSFSANCSMLMIYIMFLAVNNITEDFFSVVTFVKLSHESQQCFSASIRGTVSKIGALIGGFTCAYVYYNIKYTYILILVTSACLTIMVKLRRSSLMNPKPVIS